MAVTPLAAFQKYNNVRRGSELRGKIKDKNRLEEAREELIAVFRRRDPDAAAQAVFTHLDHNEQLAVNALSALSADGGGAGDEAADDPGDEGSTG